MALEDLVEIQPDIERRQSTDGAEILHSEDGALSEVFLDGAMPAQAESQEGDDFDYNLAKLMTKSQRNMLATKIIELNTTDLESRKEWLEVLKAGMELLGVGKLPTEKLPFEGAAQVQHPLIAEAVVQYNAHAIEEFFPATGPVKTKLMGKSNPERQAQAERVEDFMNYYLTEEDQGYYDDTDQMLFLKPIWGSVFRKGFINPRTKKPNLRCVKCEDVVIPYDATSIEDATRIGHMYPLSGATIARGIRNGLYVDVELPNPSTTVQEGAPSQALTDVADMRVQTRHEDDKNYQMLEYHIDLTLPDGVDIFDSDEFEMPYIVLVERENLEILSIRRNWKKTDPLKLKRNWFKHYKFFPGVGFYGWGFIHAIGALAKATSGGIRALLDAASFANLQGGFKTKEGGKLGGEMRLKPGVWQATEVPGEDINKMFFTPPWKEPSQALAKLIELLAGEGRRFTTVSESVIGQADNKAPVGTTIALIEQSLKLFTAVHKRMHVAARAEFKMLAEMFAEFSDIEEYPYLVDGEDKVIFRADFDERVDVLPVSDPNIFSNMIRISLAQARLELMNTNPELYTRKQWAQAHREMLLALRVPNIDDASPRASGPKYMDPAAENAMVMVGGGVQAYVDQLHEAHLAVHQNYLQIIGPQAEADPDLQPIVQALLAHCRAHEALLYRQQVAAQLGIPLPPMDITGEENEDLPPDIEAQLSMMMAERLLPPPPDPEEQAATDETMSDIQRKDAMAQADVERRDTLAAAELERKTAGFQAEQVRKQTEAQANLARTEQAHRQNLSLAAEAAAADIVRANAAAANDMRIERQTQAQENLRAEDTHERDERRAETSHQHETKREHEAHTQNLAHADADDKRKAAAAKAKPKAGAKK